MKNYVLEFLEGSSSAGIYVAAGIVVGEIVVGVCWVLENFITGS